jgi:hypothetical protein
VGRSPYQSEKRRKEIARLKKQEEKRLRRFNKKEGGEGPEGDTLAAIPTVQFGLDGLPIEQEPAETTEEGSEPDAPKENQEPGKPS